MCTRRVCQNIATALSILRSVHALFDRDEGIVRVEQALADGVAYLEGLIDAGVDPAHVPADLQAPQHNVARARLAAERQRYLSLREGMPKFQLAVPMAGATRRRIVDAAILTEITPTGALKNWLRNNSTSFTGDGYGLMVLYRPTIAGSGEPGTATQLQEIAFSVDPDLGLAFSPLWADWSGAKTPHGMQQAKSVLAIIHAPWCRSKALAKAGHRVFVLPISLGGTIKANTHLWQPPAYCPITCRALCWI